MKKLNVLLIILSVVVNLNAQQTEVIGQKVPGNYLVKSKKQLKTGLVLMGSGTASFAFGTYALHKDFGDKSGWGVAFIFAGIGAAATSIPFFISSGSNKRRAKILVKREVLMVMPGHRSSLTFNSVCFKIEL